MVQAGNMDPSGLSFFLQDIKLLDHETKARN